MQNITESSVILTAFKTTIFANLRKSPVCFAFSSCLHHVERICLSESVCHWHTNRDTSSAPCPPLTHGPKHVLTCVILFLTSAHKKGVYFAGGHFVAKLNLV